MRIKEAMMAVSNGKNIIRPEWRGDFRLMVTRDAFGLDKYPCKQTRSGDTRRLSCADIIAEDYEEV